MPTVQEIISEEEINRVHGNADFGYMTARDVVNHGVAKVFKGFSRGYTQDQILIAHGLVWPRKGQSPEFLKPKGKRYLAAMIAENLVSGIRL